MTQRPWWEPAPEAVTHEVTVPCLCAEPDPDLCRTALYISDVRILKAELDAAPRCGSWCNTHHCQNCGEPLPNLAADAPCTDAETGSQLVHCGQAALP